jgi:hypothetical protein
MAPRNHAGRDPGQAKPTGIIRFMAQVVFAFSDVIRTTDGTSYTVTACGRERSDGTWEGWLEFAPDDLSPVLRTRRETTQPNLTDLRYWTTGLTPVYLEGALARALEVPPPAPTTAIPETPAYDSPAPSATIEEPIEHPILDPFSVFAKGEDLLRQQLHALSERHLRVILRAYHLIGPGEIDLMTLSETELVALILSGVRARLGA